MESFFTQTCTGALDFARALQNRRGISIATLGPPGTSSECAANAFFASVNVPGECMLMATYEDAAARVVGGQSDLLLVANAYHRINEFYISSTLQLTTFFVFDTPPYGIARAPSAPSLSSIERIVVASHPAPAHLLQGWLPQLMDRVDLSFSRSTSEAAQQVAEGRAHACITNDQARSKFGLEFISETRPIHMLWSVFKRDSDPSFPTFASIPGGARLLNHEISHHH